MVKSDAILPVLSGVGQSAGPQSAGVGARAWILMIGIVIGDCEVVRRDEHAAQNAMGEILYLPPDVD
eukprot:7946360-Ditylum_brightwellii.AAC.1